MLEHVAVITSYEVDSSGEPFKHVARIQKRVNRKAEAHHHHKEADQSERDLSPGVI